MKDTWRAILVIAVVTILRHEEAVWQAARRAVTPSVETTAAVTHEAWRPAPQQAWQPAPQAYALPQYPVYENQQRGPLRRIGSEAVDFAEALIGVVRR